MFVSSRCDLKKVAKKLKTPPPRVLVREMRFLSTIQKVRCVCVKDGEKQSVGSDQSN